MVSSFSVVAEGQFPVGFWAALFLQAALNSAVHLGGKTHARRTQCDGDKCLTISPIKGD